MIAGVRSEQPALPLHARHRNLHGLRQGLSEGEASNLATGEQALHDFFTALYSDMVRHPGTYLMVETPDLCFNDGEWYKHQPDMTKAKGKNAHVMKGLEVLFQMVRRASLERGELVLSAAGYEQILAAVRPTSISKPKIKQALARYLLPLLV